MGLTLRIDQLVFAYGSRWLFEGFSAQAGAGVTWVQGANGSGKSTLLRLLAGALAPLAWRQQTFWCLSDPPPTPWLTIAECIGFVGGTYPGCDAARVREQVEALGLEKALATPLREASLGQQRKTLLALALALPVKLLLLDEPFNALDAASARHLADTITARAARGGQVILLTSHVEPHVPVRDTWVLAGSERMVILRAVAGST